MSERTYAANRVDRGLYVQPSNDGERRFFVASYEDGRLHGLEHGPQLATYWSWGELTAATASRIERMDFDDALGELREVARAANVGYATKREAVERALAAPGTS